MSEKAGINLLLKIETTPGSGTYATLGGLQAKKMSIGATAIDCTNHGSNQWKTLLDGAGIKSVKLTGNGVHTGDAATLDHAESQALSQLLTNFKIVDVDSNGTALATYTGSFKITAFDRDGDYKSEQKYSMSMESSGAVTRS